MSTTQTQHDGPAPALALRHPSSSSPPAHVQDVGAVLLLYHRPILRGFIDASTVTDHIASFARHSRFPVWAVNTARGPRPGIHRLRFQAILLHYSMFGSGVYRLDDDLLGYLRETDAYKVAFFQDEHYFCGQRFAFLDDHAVDCVFTCLTEPEFDKVYGRYTSVPKLVSNLPGYVSDETLAAADRFAKPDAQRRIDVGYRGRPLAPNMGRGAREKTDIALRFAELAADTDLVLDFDIEESGRLYGDAWPAFMADCRSMLGVESGVSAFDLEDRIYSAYVERLEANPDLTIDDLRDVLEPWEDRIYYRTISPRHFEAAAFRVLQVLFEGQYSGLMEPMVHYVPLKKDFSNFDEVVRLIRDPAVRRELTERAHGDLIASGEHSYARLVEQVDRTLGEAGLAPMSRRDDSQRIRAALTEGKAQRVAFQIRERAPRSIAEALGHVYVRTPQPVLRGLRHALDRYADARGAAHPKTTGAR